ncbi:DUF6597 domain-containing transcriptional factor [Marinoscillum sp.]|uniref:DUF6597 domain-containing transcriptional factor n=1 Tax=Marinoscillum sp. TaxID=2024838 RepID=UPI003BAD5B37
MIYRRREPSRKLASLIECFWVVDSEGDASVFPQKIIPDGFPELIFHYGDPYKINIAGNWEMQSRNLLAGQLTKYFYLENTGVSGMIGVKMKPCALYNLFGLNMSELVDKVLSVEEALPQLEVPEASLDGFDSFCHKMEEIVLDVNTMQSKAERAAELIVDKHGLLDLSTITDHLDIGARQLERLFKTQIGLSPKFYSRVVRLSYIFQQVQEGDYSWARLAYLAGFTDQSHFIKNFKEFTGEDPSKYRFDHPDMANFFLKK